MSAVAKTSWGTAATISAALASAPDITALVDVGKDGVSAGQRRVLGFGDIAGGSAGVETRARVAPIARGEPDPRGPPD